MPPIPVGPTRWKGRKTGKKKTPPLLPHPHPPNSPHRNKEGWRSARHSFVSDKSRYVIFGKVGFMQIVWQCTNSFSMCTGERACPSKWMNDKLQRRWRKNHETRACDSLFIFSPGFHLIFFLILFFSQKFLIVFLNFFLFITCYALVTFSVVKLLSLLFSWNVSYAFEFKQLDEIRLIIINHAKLVA